MNPYFVPCPVSFILFHFSDDETKGQRGKDAFPRSHDQVSGICGIFSHHGPMPCISSYFPVKRAPGCWLADVHTMRCTPPPPHASMFCVFLVTLLRLAQEPWSRKSLPLLKKPLTLTFRSGKLRCPQVTGGPMASAYGLEVRPT